MFTPSYSNISMLKYRMAPDIKATTLFIFIINCRWWTIVTKGTKRQTSFSVLRYKWFNEFLREIDILMMCQRATIVILPSITNYILLFLEHFALVSTLAMIKIFPQGMFIVPSRAHCIISTLRAAIVAGNDRHIVDLQICI